LVWSALTEGFAEALKRAGLWSEERLARLELAIPREPAHGDWTTNLALLLARDAKQPPRAVAEALVAAFPSDPELFAMDRGPGSSIPLRAGIPERAVGDPVAVPDAGPRRLLATITGTVSDPGRVRELTRPPLTLNARKRPLAHRWCPAQRHRAFRCRRVLRERRRHP
jgi:hypothetical protein